MTNNEEVEKIEEVKFMLKQLSSERLIEMLENYVGYAARYKISPDVFRDLIIRELKGRGWPFCPYCNVPLERKVIGGIIVFVCPECGAIYKVKDHKVVPISPRELAMLRKAVSPAPPKEVAREVSRRVAEVTAYKIRLAPDFFVYARTLPLDMQRKLFEILQAVNIILQRIPTESFGVASYYATKPKFAEFVQIVKNHLLYWKEKYPEVWEEVKDKLRELLGKYPEFSDLF